MKHWPFLPDFLPITCPECAASTSWAWFRVYHNGTRIKEEDAGDNDMAMYLCPSCGQILWGGKAAAVNSYFLGKEADAKSPNLRNAGDAVRLEA